MNIMILVHRLSGGGAERVASLWANGFCMRGHSVSVVINSSNVSDDEKKNLNSAIKLYNIYSKLGMKLSWWLNIDIIMVKQLKKIISIESPDVIICVLPPFAEWAKKATKDCNIPIINTEHNAFERPSSKPLNKKEKKRKFVINRDYDCVTVLSEADKQYIGNRLNNITVLPNPLVFTPLRELPKKDNIILAAGRINDWYVKGFDILIKAWGKVAKKYPEWKLQIAGGGKDSEVALLKNYCETMDCSNQVEFLGYCKDMLPLYQRSSVFVLSSRYEGFGLVLVEAMSQGCACIACDYNGRQQEIVDSSENGLLCKVNDIDGLSHRISQIIEDEALRKRLQEKAIKRSEFYSLDNIMDRWENILQYLETQN